MNRRDFLLSSLNLVVPFAFSENDNCGPELVISSAGDVTLGYHFPKMYESVENKYGEERARKFPFEKVSNYFNNSDINIVNLEGTLTNYSKSVGHQFNFKGSPKYVRCLNEGNVEIVNLGNNHTMDFCENGLIETLDTLDGAKIKYVGAGRNSSNASDISFINKKGFDISFLGYADVGRDYCATSSRGGTNSLDEKKIKEEIFYAKSNSDFAIVSCHWGVERDYFPSSRQKYFARKMIDSGADVVFGHHPHVLQGVEKYNGGIIFYSLGNFCFGGNSFPADRDSVIARVSLDKNGKKDFTIIPVKTHPESMVFQPFVPNVTSGIEEKINSRSKVFGIDVESFRF